MNWRITQTDYTEKASADNGNRFLIGNGAMGVRGTLEEHRKDQLVAVNLAGIYDKVGDGWREPLNAPNPFYTVASVAGQALQLPQFEPLEHEQRLNFETGEASRRTVWQAGDGQVTIETQRFASMAQPHLLCLRYTLTASAETEAELFCGIDADVWDIHGPHYVDVSFGQQQDGVLCVAKTQNGKDTVAVCRRNFVQGAAAKYREESLLAGQQCHLLLPANQPVTVISVCSIYTTADVPDPAEEAVKVLQNMGAQSYNELYVESCRCWQDIWRRSLVQIEGDEEAETAVNYSLYHLNCIAPRSGKPLSIPARGLSGQTYKGAIFWDSEMFILDYFLATQPEVAKSLVEYRIATLPGALQKAKEYGWQGAFYAWESQEGGFDACSDYNVTDVFTGRPVRTYFRDKQVHISAAVVWALRHYIEYTSDTALLAQGGAEVILECARFYWSLLVRLLPKACYELHDVIGPDEYHERVNNNAYTNRMALYVFEAALATAAQMRQENPKEWAVLAMRLGAEELLCNIEDAKEKLYVPQPNKQGIIEQFDGYFKLEDVSVDEVKSRLKDPREYWGGGSGVASDTQVIKQADVVTMLEMFHNDYEQNVLRQNWEFYEPHTEHGSSLSACMYALLACRFGRADLAMPFFMKSATAEIRGGGKQWAGLVYIGGTHPAAAGGAWKTMAQGFAGLHLNEAGQPALKPCLPPNWQSLRFRFVHGGQVLLAAVTPEGAAVTPIEEEDFS